MIAESSEKVAAMTSEPLKLVAVCGGVYRLKQDGQHVVDCGVIAGGFWSEVEQRMAFGGCVGLISKGCSGNHFRVDAINKRTGG